MELTLTYRNYLPWMPDSHAKWCQWLAELGALSTHHRRCIGATGCVADVTEDDA